MKRFAIKFAACTWLLSLMICATNLQAQTTSSQPQSVMFGTGLSLAGALLPWGNQFTLQGSQAIDRRAERCAYEFSYDVSTASSRPVNIIATAVYLEQRQLHQGQAVIVRPSEKKIIRGRVYLFNGENTLRFQVETNAGVIEKSASVLVSGC
jgi:hypothetical protein